MNIRLFTTPVTRNVNAKIEEPIATAATKYQSGVTITCGSTAIATAGGIYTRVNRMRPMPPSIAKTVEVAPGPNELSAIIPIPAEAVQIRGKSSAGVPKSCACPHPHVRDRPGLASLSVGSTRHAALEGHAHLDPRNSY